MRHPIRVVVVHVDLVAQWRDLLAATLVKAIVALVAVQSGEQQPATAFAKGEREESFADKLQTNAKKEIV